MHEKGVLKWGFAHKNCFKSLNYPKFETCFT